MTAELHSDYHDYVFRKGRLIGDFDNMYRHASGIPWDQDKRWRLWSSRAGLLLLEEYTPYRSILEVGCGMGYVTRYLKRYVKQPNGCVEGFDISPEAVRRARAMHPAIHFYVDDVTSAEFRPRRKYDLVVIKDLFWYVFPRMNRVVRNILDCVKPRGLLYINQSFPALNGSYVGKEEIPSPEVLLRHFSKVEILHSAVLRNHQLNKDGPVFHFLGRRALR